MTSRADALSTQTACAPPRWQRALMLHPLLLVSARIVPLGLAVKVNRRPAEPRYLSRDARSRRCPIRVTVCRGDYIDLMAGVPRIAADLLQRASRQPWARCGRFGGVNKTQLICGANAPRPAILVSRLLARCAAHIDHSLRDRAHLQARTRRRSHRRAQAEHQGRERIFVPHCPRASSHPFG
jgi:hypothetical protein